MNEVELLRVIRLGVGQELDARGIVGVIDAPRVESDSAPLGEPYDGQSVINRLLQGHPDINPNGKWWARAVKQVPTDILYDDIDKAETDDEMAVLEVNKVAINKTYGNETRAGFSTGNTVMLPALDANGVELPHLACVPNANMLRGVRSIYAHSQVDQVVENRLVMGWYADADLERDAQRGGRVNLG